jgi:hypothetical protein
MLYLPKAILGMRVQDLGFNKFPESQLLELNYNYVQISRTDLLCTGVATE